MFIINPYIFADVNYFVDDYSPEIAISFFKLSSTATNCIRVRRDSDNSEQDIGFSGTSLDTTSLLSFVGANNGFIVTFYNQGTSGSTYDATQSTGANQLQIVSSGSVTTAATNGKTAATNNGTSNRYTWSTSIATSGGAFTNLFYFDRNSITGETTALGRAAASGSIINGWITNGNYFSYNTPALGNDSSSTGEFLSRVIRDGSNNTSMYRNGTQVTGSPSTITATLSFDQLMGRATGGFQGDFQEFIHFFSDQTSNITAIEAEINSRY